MKPMLAHDYHKRGHHITWPAYVQPKLDGVRALVTRKGNDIIFTSRDENEFPHVAHLIPFLLNMMADGEIWDGELYCKKLCFEDLISAVKRKQPNTLKLEYWVYDCVMKGNFEDRHLHIDSKIRGNGPIIPVPTLLVECEEDMLACHKVMLQKGYEGTMIRNSNGGYANKRSSNLQKYKNMIDAEFKIVRYEEGTGKDVGCIIFVCTTESGKEFTVRPNGSYERRMQWYKEGKKLIGKYLTVQYQNLSEDGVPRFPIGINIRDYE